MLTAAQHAFFETFGFLKLPGALAADVGWIQDEFEAAWRLKPEVVHDGSQRTIYPASFITATRRLSTLVEHDVVCGVLDDLLGVGWSSYGGDGNFYSGDTGWHSDVAPDHWEAKSITRHVKVAFYLDPLTAETGALRVIPGSHHWGDRYATLLEEQVPGGANGPLALAGPDVPAVAIAIVPGDLVAFDHRLKHAAFGGGKRRRMFTINNFAPCPTEAQRDAALKVMRFYRDHEKVNWTDPQWLAWIRSLTPRGQRNHALTVAFGTQLMTERELTTAAG